MERVEELLRDLAVRLRDEPDLDDFLGWWGGTLEYWVHICTAAIARRTGWAARSEVPYITDAPSPSAKTAVKWADGAFVWPDGEAALLEVKTIPHREAALGGAVAAIPTDLAALHAANWSATLAHKRGTDRYTDEDWWARRDEVTSLTGIQIGLIHGRAPLPDLDEAVTHGVRKGLARLDYRYRNATPPDWMGPHRSALEQPVVRERMLSKSFEGVLYAWTVPISVA